MNRIIILITVFFASGSLVWGQSMSPKSFVDSAGRYYQRADQPIYLFASTSPNGSPQMLKTHASGPIYLEGHGVHRLKHLNHQTQKEDVLLVHADGKAPVSIAEIDGGTMHKSTAGLVYGGDLTLQISSKDDMAGVEKIYLALGEKSFEEYRPLSLSEEGNYQVRFYAVDRVGNAEEVKKLDFSIDLSAPKTYHNIIGISEKQVISVNSSIYLESEDLHAGVRKTFFRFDDAEDFLPYRGGKVPFQTLEDGWHELHYYSVDHTGNEETPQSVRFYLDKTAPILSADILGDKYLVGDKVYFSGRTKLKLTAVDNKSGIKDLMYSVNGSGYKAYENPFYLPNKSGKHQVDFYALDETGNKNKSAFGHSVGLIYLDLTGPTVDIAINGPTFYKGDTVVVGSKSTFTIVAKDYESGLKSKGYRLDGSNEELLYHEPFKVETSGMHTLQYFSDDNVNNRNTKSLQFVSDLQGPQVGGMFSAKPLSDQVYPSYTTLYLTAEDQQVAMGSIYYSINGARKKLYASPLKGFKKNKDYSIEITATDHLGNETLETIKFSTANY